MFKLMRCAALGLVLPLVVGAPAVLVAAPSYAAATTDTDVALTDSSPVYGQLVFAAATVSAAGEPVTEGSVQFSVKNPSGAYKPFGTPVALDENGEAVSPAVPQQDGTPMDVTAQNAFYQVLAVYQPESAAFTASSDPSEFISVLRSGSTMGVHVAPTTITADLSAALPGGMQQGSLAPSGSVAFRVNGEPVDTAEVDEDGVATLHYALPSGGPQTVSASYGGDDRYGASTRSRTRTDPTIRARVFSRKKIRAKWHRAPVHIFFKCDPAGSELVVECPDDVTLTRSGTNKSVTRTIVAADGGTATVTVSGINIDLRDPEIKIVGRSCRARDNLSGVKRGTCSIRRLHNGHYVAVAVDRAGNRAEKRVFFR